MASLFDVDPKNEVRLLDAGAGIGSLTSAFIDRVCSLSEVFPGIEATLYEVEPKLMDYLHVTLAECEAVCSQRGIPFEAEVVPEDFILDATRCLSGDLLSAQPQRHGYTHAILNPPYKKIKSDSHHRRLLRSIGIETSNLYTGFLALSILLLAPGGELVAIVPRSFCNGPYFKPFRQFLLAQMTLRQIHVFESRKDAFRDDEVLQENIIIHAVKEKANGSVRVTSSSGSDFRDLTRIERSQHQVVHQQDPHMFLHIATNDLDQHVIDRMAVFSHTLDGLGVAVSTGPVVDFRLKEYLRDDPAPDTVPLIYPVHFEDGFIQWPNEGGRKPNAMVRNEDTEKWLLPQGTYTLVRRFSSKEEARRVVAAVYTSEKITGEAIGFENHLNVFHNNKQSLVPEVAKGLAVYLNATLVDAYFRQFNGHTQVNATDLRMLPYPSLETLIELGEAVDGDQFPDQQTIDHLLEAIIQQMADIDNTDPVKAQQKVEDALRILEMLGFPKGQQNERSALTLLALLDLKPEDDWSEVAAPLIGITPIMDFCRDYYGRRYAPNTRETFRRQTMHQFVEAGLALANPDKPGRPPNSPKYCYQIEPQAQELLKTYGTSRWKKGLQGYLKEVKTLKERYARARKMEMVPVRLAGGKEVTLAAGAHSELIKAIVEEFAPRFTPGGEVLYLGETGAKRGHFDIEALSGLGVKLDVHGKMPDVVIYYRERNWLILVEAVTSHGPVDSKRRNELEQLFQRSSAGLVYVTAFPSRAMLREYLPEISWETEVWVAAAPSHLIHFDGARFLGPYPR